MALAEVGKIKNICGKSLIETNIRQEYNLNVVAVRKTPEDEFAFINAQNFKFEDTNILLVAGTFEDITKYTSIEASELKKSKGSDLRKLFRNKK